MGPYNGFNPLNLRLHLGAASLSTFFFGGILIPCALSTLTTATPVVVYLAETSLAPPTLLGSPILQKMKFEMF